MVYKFHLVVFLGVFLLQTPASCQVPPPVTYKYTLGFGTGEDDCTVLPNGTYQGPFQRWSVQNGRKFVSMQGNFDQGRKNGLWREFAVGSWPNPHTFLCSEGNFYQGKREGKWIYYSEFGKQSEGFYHNGKEEGFWRNWAPYGNDHAMKLQSELNFKNGLRDGRSTSYWYSGLVQSDGVYSNGLAISVTNWSFRTILTNGHLRDVLGDQSISKEPSPGHTIVISPFDEIEQTYKVFPSGARLADGLYLRKFTNGAKIMGTYKEGKPWGIWGFWATNGTTLGYYSLTDGSGQWATWDVQRRQKLEEGKFINGLRDGYWQAWNESGKKTSDIMYRMGEQYGPFTNWQAGVPILQGEYRGEQIRWGHWTYRTPSGSIYWDCNLTNGSGMWTNWDFEQGKYVVSSFGALKRGQNDGIWKSFSYGRKPFIDYDYDKGFLLALTNYNYGHQITSQINRRIGDVVESQRFVNGKLQSIWYTQNGVFIGTGKQYYDSGSLMSENEYTNGTLVHSISYSREEPIYHIILDYKTNSPTVSGIQTWWDKDGKKIKEVELLDGAEYLYHAFENFGKPLSLPSYCEMEPRPPGSVQNEVTDCKVSPNSTPIGGSADLLISLNRPAPKGGIIVSIGINSNGAQDTLFVTPTFMKISEGAANGHFRIQTQAVRGAATRIIFSARIGSGNIRADTLEIH